MSDFIVGLIAVVMVGLFFGFYLITLAALPLTIIFLGVFALIVADLITSVRKGKDQTGD
ncbi:MAG: hypothetical protein ACE5JS_22765 [Nitrospinota bacterium]